MTELLELAIEFDVKGSWGEILPENLGNVDKESHEGGSHKKPIELTSPQSVSRDQPNNHRY